MAGGVTGSVDAPPIVIRSAAWKSVAGLLAGLVITAVSVWIIPSVHGNPIALELGAVFFGLCAIVFAVRLVRPVSVTLSPTGIALFNGWRSAELPWSDIEEFRFARIYTNLFVGLRLAPSAKGSHALRAFNTAMVGVDGILPSGLTVGPLRLAELIKAASQKWANPPVPFDSVS